MNGLIKNDMKKYKMVSVNYTTECIKNPRCSFCYLKKQRVLDLLKSNNSIESHWNDLLGTLENLLPKTEQIAIAYNGVDFFRLALLVDLVSGRMKQLKQKIVINITTNPEFVQIHHAKYIRLMNDYSKIGMWALSLDEEKISVSNWIKKAKDIKQTSKVGANILMTDKMFGKIHQVLEKIAPYADQIHLLRPKNYKVSLPVELRKEIVFMLKSRYKNLFVDECFNWEFTGVPCSRGKDFVSINPDGSISKCSFDGNNIYSKGRLTKCPFI
jgi:hypothetical protein